MDKLAITSILCLKMIRYSEKICLNSFIKHLLNLTKIPTKSDTKIQQNLEHQWYSQFHHGLLSIYHLICNSFPKVLKSDEILEYQLWNNKGRWSENTSMGIMRRLCTGSRWTWQIRKTCWSVYRVGIWPMGILWLALGLFCSNLFWKLPTQRFCRNAF